MLSEAKIIQSLAVASQGFIGDDAAILPNVTTERYVVTQDVLIEDIHFRTHYFSASDLAYKSLQVNLSDLAAMGATPKYILCAVSIPTHHGEYAQSFLQQLLMVAKEADVVLIGGDTTASSDKLHIVITAIGLASIDKVKYRHDAKSSDIIAVAGNLGYAHVGFKALESNLNISNEYTDAFLRPKAKVKEGLWLAQQLAVTSMMDISDGLYIDLKRLCDASNVSAVVAIEKLTYDQLFSTACGDLQLDPLNVLLTGGEDYGLIFSVREDAAESMSKDFLSVFGYSLKFIGQMTTGSAVTFTRNHEKIDLPLQPFTHFGEKL